MINITGLEKKYGEKQVLRGLTFEVAQGELFGLIGPNGAGKTTTMKILAGLLQPDAGEVTICMNPDGPRCNESVRSLKRQIGYMPDFFGVYDNLTVMEYMEFFADIYRIPVRKQAVRISELLGLFGLEKKKAEFVDTLSRGVKQRLCLARTLIHDPKLLLLDEPASGMEPEVRVEVRRILKELAGSGKTIVVSSHILSEITQLCTSIGIMDHGEMLLCGSCEEVLRRAKKNSPVTLQVLNEPQRAMEILKQQQAVQNISADGNTISIDLVGDQQTEAELLRALIQQGISVSSYRRAEGSLETLFMRLMQKRSE